MAPDLNSVPASPRHPAGSTSHHTSVNSSRRPSQNLVMGPPPLPLASPGGTIPPSQHTFLPLSPTSSSMPNSAAGGSPTVPVRHPRPMTAAELHLELEKEQEAVVNRLTRELSALRAHSASVASTASSTSAGFLTEPLDSSMLTGPTHPTPSRRHRSSSSVSRGSIPPNLISTHTPGISHASADRANAAGANTHPHRASLYGPSLHGRSSSIGLTTSTSNSTATATATSTARYEEAAHARQELEAVRGENEALRQRVKELEALVRGRRNSSETGGLGGASRERGRRSGEMRAWRGGDT